MAVGETAGAPGRPGAVVSSSGRKVAKPAEADAAAAEGETPAGDEPAPLVQQADPEFEKLLEAEEEIARLSRDSSETPHFRPDAD